MTTSIYRLCVFALLILTGAPFLPSAQAYTDTGDMVRVLQGEAPGSTWNTVVIDAMTQATPAPPPSPPGTQTNGGTPVYHSTQLEETTLEGDFTPDDDTVNLAIFSDDGSDVSIGPDAAHLTKIWNGRDQTQTLEILSTSLHLLPITLTAGQTYHIKIDYSNIIYNLHGDIDGATLFAFGKVGQLVGPANVPGLSQYTYSLNPPGGITPTSISWAVDQSTAHITGAGNQLSTTIAFDNKPEVNGSNYVTVTANYTVNGQTSSASTKVAVVQVQVSNPTNSAPGLPSSGIGPHMGPEVFQVKAGATYVTTASPPVTDPANFAIFTSTAVAQPAEPWAYVDSQDPQIHANPEAFVTSAQVSLTPPAAKPDAINHIQVGYIQKGTVTGSADYTLTNADRVLTVPTNDTPDWLGGGVSIFPWYDASTMWSPTGSGSQSQPINLSDSPSQSLPSEWRSFTQQGQPNTTNPNYGQQLSSSNVELNFHLFMAAQTKDTDNGANNSYFDEADGYWGVDFDYPVNPRQSIVSPGNPISTPLVVTPIDVNRVPLSINRQDLWAVWTPYP